MERGDSCGWMMGPPQGCPNKECTESKSNKLCVNRSLGLSVPRLHKRGLTPLTIWKTRNASRFRRKPGDRLSNAIRCHRILPSNSDRPGKDASPRSFLASSKFVSCQSCWPFRLDKMTKSLSEEERRRRPRLSAPSRG